MPHRISDIEVIAAQDDFKKKYPPFRPFALSAEAKARFGHYFDVLVATQNGMDTDDYCVLDGNKIERYIGNHPAGSKVLILGVGTGRETLVARDLGYQAVGVTLGSRNIDYGVLHLGLDPNAHLECVLECLPFPANHFDVVTGFQVFEHAVAPMIFLLEQFRVLKHGGKLMLEWPPADNYTLDDNPHHQICYVPGQAHALFRKSGFENVKVYYDDFSPVPQEAWWSGVHNKMLCIEGTKGHPNKDYLQKVL